ncbi:MAG TPA: GGDEF domain-containing protein [Pirellulaceae bacterium]|nr:GGDEF domain-containing protein [Pirellulaceae bacterium]
MNLSQLIAEIDIWSFGLPPPVGLAIVVFLGYLVSWQQRANQLAMTNVRRDLHRAKTIVAEVEKLSRDLQRRLSNHHTSVQHFKQRIDVLADPRNNVGGPDLSDEAERMLKSTLQLANQVAQAYDEIRQQTNLLMQISEVRTDALTGLSNRRALDEVLAAQVARLARYGNLFSIAIFDIDHFKKVNDEHGHVRGDQLLQQLGEQFLQSVRETDIVARYGGEEFVVVLPETDLAGAAIVAERVRREIQEKLKVTVSGGIAEGLPSDDARSILMRADTALYSAKSAGRNRVHRHDGEEVGRVREEV